MAKPITSYFLDIYKSKLNTLTDDMLFKDTPENIYRYFDILEEDNSGYIYFSPENLFYSYSNWDNFYTSLDQNIIQNDIEYPTLISLFPEMKWDNDIIHVVESLNNIISSIESQNILLEAFNGFNWIDKNLKDLLKKDDNLTDSEVRLRGRLLLQEMLPVQQYSGGEVYDLSHVEYIKAFYQSKGTIRDNEYMLKFFGYDVDLGTAGEEIIPLELDWTTYNTKGLDKLIHQGDGTSTEVSADGSLISLSSLVENDVNNYSKYISAYETTCQEVKMVSNCCNPEELKEQEQSSSNENTVPPEEEETDTGIPPEEEEEQTEPEEELEDGTQVEKDADGNIVTTTVDGDNTKIVTLNPETGITSVKLLNKKVNEFGIQTIKTTISKIDADGVVLGQLQYFKNNGDYKNSLDKDKRTFENFLSKEKVEVTTDIIALERKITTYKDDSKLDEIKFAFDEPNLTKTVEIENIYDSEDYFETTTYVNDETNEKIVYIDFIKIDENFTKNIERKVTVYKDGVKDSSITYKVIEFEFNPTLEELDGDKRDTSYKLTSVLLNGKRTVSTKVKDDGKNYDKDILISNIYEDEKVYNEYTNSDDKLVKTRIFDTDITYKTFYLGDVDVTWESLFDDWNQKETSKLSFNNLTLNDIVLDNLEIRSSYKNSGYEELYINGTKLENGNVVVERNLPETKISFEKDSVLYNINVNYKTENIKVEIIDGNSSQKYIFNSNKIKDTIYRKIVDEANDNISYSLRAKCDITNITYSYKKEHYSDKITFDEPQVEIEHKNEFLKNKEIYTTITTTKTRNNNGVYVITVTKQIKTIEIKNVDGSLKVVTTIENIDEEGKSSKTSSTEDYYDQTVGTGGTETKEDEEPTDEEILLDTSSDEAGETEVIDEDLADTSEEVADDSSDENSSSDDTSDSDENSSSDDTSDSDENSSSDDSLLGGDNNSVNDQVLSLDFNIDIIGDSFKGLFTADVENLVKEVLSARSTASVKIDTINVLAPITERYAYVIEELLNRIIEWYEEYNFAPQELLTYQKNILDCRMLFSKFGNYVSNICYSNIGNVGAVRSVNNDIDNQVETFMYKETFSYTEVDQYIKDETLFTKFDKNIFDSYEVYRYVNNRIRKSVSNENSILILNGALIRDDIYTYEYNVEHRDDCALYLWAVSNRKADFKQINNVRYCMIKNLTIDDSKFTYAPTFTDDKWEYAKSDKFYISNNGLIFDDLYQHQTDDLGTTVTQDLSILDESNYYEIKVSNSDTRTIRNINSRRITNIKFEENLDFIRTFIDLVSFNVSEETQYGIKADFVDAQLPPKVNNKLSFTLDNRHIQRVFNDDRVKEFYDIVSSENVFEQFDLLKTYVNNIQLEKVNNMSFILVDNKPKILESLTGIKNKFDDVFSQKADEFFRIEMFDTEIFVELFKQEVLEDTDKSFSFKFIEHMFNERINNLNYSKINNLNVSSSVRTVGEKILIDLKRLFIDLFNFEVNEDGYYISKKHIQDDMFDKRVSNIETQTIHNEKYSFVVNKSNLPLEDIRTNQALSFSEYITEKRITNSSYTTVSNIDAKPLSAKLYNDVTSITPQHIFTDFNDYKVDGSVDESFTYSKDEIYKEYVAEYLVNGSAKRIISNTEYDRLNNLEIKKEAEKMSYVLIDREDGKQFKINFEDITEDNFDFYVFYTVKIDSTIESAQNSSRVEITS